MDGNGRWGISKRKSRNYGHKKGLETVETVINASIEEKVKFLTLFVFSTENWKRPKNEIKYLFQLLEYYLNSKITDLQKRKIKIKIFGNLNKFPKSLKSKLFYVEKVTKRNSVIQINMALNYGSRQELIDSINKIKKKKLPINEKNINNNLYTRNIPDPEILIRTGNTNRISNFLIWQSIYSEIFFVKKMWPEFTKFDFKKIIRKYKRINRNFGGIHVGGK